MRYLAAWLGVILFCCCGCAGRETAREKRYEASFSDVFDTITLIVGYAEREEDFTRDAEKIHRELQEYHRLYDIYREYDGVNNLKTVNDSAGKAAVKVDEKIMDLLLFSKEIYAETEGAVNIAMGSVLKLWHAARTTGGEIPTTEQLRKAAQHIDLDQMILDEQAGTVYLADESMRLDVGAVAKGFATQRVSECAPEGMLLSVGGNLCCTGCKPDGSPWNVGLQDPRGEVGMYLQKISLSGGALVTSGDYQRYFIRDGRRYHHIIDGKTLFPAEDYQAVTVWHEDSGVADALSTALFLMSREDGEALLNRYGAQAIWIDAQGKRYSSGDYFYGSAPRA